MQIPKKTLLVLLGALFFEPAMAASVSWLKKDSLGKTSAKILLQQVDKNKGLPKKETDTETLKEQVKALQQDSVGHDSVSKYNFIFYFLYRLNYGKGQRTHIFWD